MLFAMLRQVWRATRGDRARRSGTSEMAECCGLPFLPSGTDVVLKDLPVQVRSEVIRFFKAGGGLADADKP